MSKVLYPRPKPNKPRKSPRNKIYDEPYHVYYDDPNNQIEPEWRHYGSELAVKLDSWYRCKFLGFHTEATLYDRNEFNEGVIGSQRELR